MPDEKNVSATDFYTTRPENHVALQVVIGDAQAGGTVLRLNGAPVPFVDQKQAVDLGVIKTPAVLDCITVVKDVNEKTNRTSVTYRLTGGEDPKVSHFALEASESGRVRYAISFVLV